MQNDTLSIVTGSEHPVLRKKSEAIMRVTDEVITLIRAMVATMKKADGIGLAAPQIGQPIRLFVVDPLAFDKERSKWEFKKIAPPDVSKPMAFINPSIATYPKGEENMVEGCLSLPGWEGLVKRSRRITMKAQTLNGEVFKLQAKGLLARVLQHEYDHLEGRLICDIWEKEREVKRKESKVKGIVFFGDSEFSQIVLRILKGTPYAPEIIIGKDTQYQILNTKYSLGITASYGHIIPESVIKKFKHGILNIHPSLLPHYRGPSPLQATILNGDKKSGVSIMQLVKKMDAGPLVAQGELLLDKPSTAGELGVILFEDGTKLLLDILPDYLEGSLPLVLQDETKATYTALIKKEDARIDWSKDAQVIEREIRAYQPWPIAYTFFDHRGKHLRVQILEGHVLDPLQAFSDYGTIERRKNELVVRCSQGLLRITKLRPEGKKEMSGEEFLQGYAPTLFPSHSA